MTNIKFLILAYLFILCSCGNNPSESKQPNTTTNNPIDSNGLKKGIEQRLLDSSFSATLTQFKQAVLSKDLKTFRQLSIDTLNCCHTIFSQAAFIKNCFNEVFDTALTNKFSKPELINKIDKTVYTGYFSNHVLKMADYSGNTITLKQFQIVKERTHHGPWTMTFDFIKTNKGYKLISCDSYGGPVCCH